MLQYRVDEFMVNCRNKAHLPKTMGSYEQALRLFERFMQEQYDIYQEKDAISAHITDYVNYLQRRGKHTAVADERSRRANYPQNRRDTGDAISATAINVLHFRAFLRHGDEKGLSGFDRRGFTQALPKVIAR